MPGVQLGEIGRKQIARAAELIAQPRPGVLQSSPQLRTMQSAAIIGARCNLPIEVAPAFDEVNMGRWTGCSFADLASDPAWHLWNEKRGSATPPGGESMAAVQKRVLDHIEQLRARQGTAVIVSHAEPIRAALMHFLGVPLDRFYEVEVEPGSVNTLTFEGERVFVSQTGCEVAA